MGDFFNGWRRKVGTLMLMITSAFMAVWLRSCVVEDEFAITVFVRLHDFSSEGCEIQWMGWDDNGSRQLPILRTRSRRASTPHLRCGLVPLCPERRIPEAPPVDHGLAFDRLIVTWDLTDEAGLEQGTLQVWTVSHLAIVVPLTLFSAADGALCV